MLKTTGSTCGRISVHTGVADTTVASHDAIISMQFLLARLLASTTCCTADWGGMQAAEAGLALTFWMHPTMQGSITVKVSKIALWNRQYVQQMRLRLVSTCELWQHS